MCISTCKQNSIVVQLQECDENEEAGGLEESDMGEKLLEKQ